MEVELENMPLEQVLYILRTHQRLIPDEAQAGQMALKKLSLDLEKPKEKKDGTL